MGAKVLLKKIISKGGIIGASGKLYVSDERLAAQFILECSEQLHTEAVRTLWGKQLAGQIAKYRMGLLK